MKPKPQILFMITTSVLLLLCTCSGNKKEEGSMASDEEQETPVVAAPRYDVNAVFQEQLGGVFAAYVLLKDAFVASDGTQVKVASAKVEEILKTVDMKLISGDAHSEWMTYLGSLEGALKEIQATDDLAVQRQAFSGVSASMYSSIKAFGLGGVTAYYDFCPMAFDNAGGFWLSDSKEIKNPYFGDMMLTCGSVKETLQ